MDDFIYAVQGGPERQHRVFYSTVHALKWIFPSLPGDSKDLVSAQKLLTGEGGCIYAKKVLGCTIDAKLGTVALPGKSLKTPDPGGHTGGQDFGYGAIG